MGRDRRLHLVRRHGGTPGEGQQDEECSEPFMQVHCTKTASIRLGSLFLTFQTRAFTGQHVISADGSGGSLDDLVGVRWWSRAHPVCSAHPAHWQRVGRRHVPARAMFGVGRCGGIEKTSLISLTRRRGEPGHTWCEHRRLRVPAQATRKGHSRDGRDPSVR
jgi:hypothetical protein